MKKLRYIIPVLVLALAACAKIDVNQQSAGSLTSVPPTEDDKITVSFTVEMNRPVATKAMAHEPEITSMRVAVFGSSGYLKEYTEATLENVEEKNYNEANGNPKYTYSVKLNFSDKPRIVHFIANGPESLSFDSEDIVIADAMVSYPQDAYWQRMYLANGISAEQTWDETTNSYVYVKLNDGSYKMSAQTQSDFEDIPMIRNFAEITVTENAANFELISYALMNYPETGAIAPYRGEDGFFCTKNTGDKAYEDYTYNTITGDYAGWLPSTAEINTSVPEENDANAFNLRPKYVYERPSTKTNPTWIIVAGKYTGASSSNTGTTYYKIFLNDESGTNLTLYRNFSYTISINEVTRAGYDSAEAAAQGAGSGDVSASVSASIASVSDGAATLTVQPATDWTFANGETPYSTIKFAFYGTGASNDQVTVETLSIGEAGAVIAGSAVESGSGITISSSDDEEGFRTLTFTTTTTSAATKTQVIRITGTKTGGSTLYRDVTLNLISKQVMRLSLNPEGDAPGEVESGKDQKVVARMELPDNLPRSIFPLIMNIEPSPQCLNPEVKSGDAAANDKMPVEAGTSLADGSSNSYHFVKTISWEDYVNAAKTSDNYHIIDSDFVTVVALAPGPNKCTVYVTNEYFQDADANLGVYAKRYFSEAKMVVGEMNDEELYPVTFSFNMDPGEYQNVKVTLKMKGVYPNINVETGLTQVGTVGEDGVRTYEFTASAVNQHFSLLTSNPEDDLSIEISALHYVTCPVTVVNDITVNIPTDRWDNNQGYRQRSYSAEDITATFSSARGQTSYIILGSGNSSNLTISSSNNKIITRIEITTTTGTLSTNTGSYSSGVWTGSATSITFTATAGTRITAISVTYVP